MFFPILFLLFVVLNLYVVLRIRTLFWTRRQRLIFTAAYILAVAVFPVAEFLADVGSSVWLQALQAFGLLSLPFLMYLFLLVLVIDILRGLNLILGIIPARLLVEKRARILILLLFLLIPSAVVAWGSVKFADIHINRYSIQIPRKSSHLRHLRIALASDFHLRETTDARFMEHVADLVNSLDADVLLIPGDMLEGHRGEDGQLAEVERQFQRIRTTYGTFASLGNHEFYGRQSGSSDFFRKASITVLEDSLVVVDSCFTLIGRKDSHASNRMAVGELVKRAEKDLPVIVMDHRPTDLGSASQAGADIVVSGHTHNGQLFPLNFITDQIYDLSWGYKKILGTNFFVTSGVRLWGPPVRTAGDSEIMLISVELVDA